MLPAQQRLKAHDLAGADVVLWLVNGPQLSTGDRIAQVVFQKAALTKRGAHRCVEVAIGPPAFIFGTVERNVGVREQGMPISRIIGTDGNPNGDRDRPIDFHVLARALQGFQDGLGDAAGGGGKGKARRYDGKLVAAQSRQHLVFIQHSTNAFCDGLKGPVARRVSE